MVSVYGLSFAVRHYYTTLSRNLYTLTLLIIALSTLVFPRKLITRRRDVCRYVQLNDLYYTSVFRLSEHGATGSHYARLSQARLTPPPPFT